MEPWRTAIVEASDGQIRMRGPRRDVADDRAHVHRHDLPAASIAAADARRNGRCSTRSCRACADHGSGAPSCATARLAMSGNRSRVSAAIAAGILAVGDEHGGAGSGCMEMIAAGHRARHAANRSRSSDVPREDRQRASRDRQTRRRPWSSRAHERSAHAGAVRPGQAARTGRRRHPLHAGDRGRGRATGQADDDQRRWRPGRGALRHGIPAAVRAADVHHRPRRRPDRRGDGRTDARAADAHSDSRHLRRRRRRHESESE